MATNLQKNCSFALFIRYVLLSLIVLRTGLWDLIVLIPDYCPPFYLLQKCCFYVRRLQEKNLQQEIKFSR